MRLLSGQLLGTTLLALFAASNAAQHGFDARQISLGLSLGLGDPTSTSGSGDDSSSTASATDSSTSSSTSSTPTPTSTPSSTPTPTPTSTPSSTPVSSKTMRTVTTVVFVSGSQTITSAITTDAVVADTTSKPSPTLNGGSGSGSSSGLSSKSKSIIGGVVGGVGGAILLGGILLVALRLRRRRRAQDADEDEYLAGAAATGAAPLREKNANRPFQSTLENYHNPAGKPNTSANF